MQRSMETQLDDDGCGAALRRRAPLGEIAIASDRPFALSAQQCHQARAALGISRTRLGSLAGLCGKTVLQFEKGMPAKGTTTQKLRAALEAEGVELIPDNGGGAGVRLRKV